jgi:hypothetical protein
LSVLAFVTMEACSPGSSPPPRPSTEVIVGVQSDPLAGAIGTVHVRATVAGATADDETFPPSNLPHEVDLFPPDGGDASAPIAVRVEGYLQPGWTPQSMEPPVTVLVRTAETQFVPGETKLLRMLLRGSCLLGLPDAGLPGAPVCTPPQTCIGGVCQSDVVPVGSLEPYASNWPQNAPDVCKPVPTIAPVVQVGTGQTDYLPVTSGQTVQMEQGSQGGHHIWVAVRQEGVAQTGTTTTITSVQPTTGVVGPTLRFIFTFQQDQGGFCKLAGLRYQLDIGGADYHQFLGQPLDVTVTVADQAGATATGTAHVVVSPTLLCASGFLADAGGGC